MFPQLQRVPNLLVGYPETQQMLETFLRDRAFKAMKVGSTGATCVVGGYASFVNHACPGDITQINARVNPIASVAPRFVLKATRDIRPGEEIFIDYGKPLGFRCCCRVCEDIRSNKFGGRLRLWMKYQWEKQRWCRQWKRGKSMQTVWSY
ncbi:SET domain-containing protein [Sodiomyces alkalinus F11]|uniref:SET domain-containing protein n=1 Tax=Sodiomyces alkalinus (strain CBS 110278 / VKM F-3762 / F11) TaxID=1314773 RepID=A0A3N2Q4N6_SODAK|nr:SET domain-containing protein [Sodiomyces alkalinus F11]ROT41575.1 SET domain-containing protein [Sodiomyces alkalinus F11]